MPAAVVLSRRQAKEADRVGGIELMIPYPAALGPGPKLDDDEECEASPAERACAEQLLRDACAENGLVVMSVVVARVHVPRSAPLPGHGTHALQLAVVITGRRWVRAATNRQPRVMFAEPPT